MWCCRLPSAAQFGVACLELRLWAGLGPRTSLAGSRLARLRCLQWRWHPAAAPSGAPLPAGKVFSLPSFPLRFGGGPGRVPVALGGRTGRAGSRQWALPNPPLRLQRGSQACGFAQNLWAFPCPKSTIPDEGKSQQRGLGRTLPRGGKRAQGSAAGEGRAGSPEGRPGPAGGRWQWGRRRFPTGREVGMCSRGLAQPSLAPCCPGGHGVVASPPWARGRTGDFWAVWKGFGVRGVGASPTAAERREFGEGRGDRCCPGAE